MLPTVGQAMWQVADMERQGYCIVIKTPFIYGEPYRCGATHKGITGWEGRPDFEGTGETMTSAIAECYDLVQKEVNRQAP